MKRLDDVARLVSRLAPETVCEHCIGRTLDLELDQPVLAVHELTGGPEFERRKGACSLCGEDRMVIRAC